MGASLSIQKPLTHQQIFELTRDTRGLMNILLEYMLKEITVRDFLALSNPAECKKYVIFLANNLHKYFYELQITPTKDKKGVIAFRSVKDMTSPPQGMEEEKQSLCLTLAYYYTRIFQIYGALALTLVDDANYASDTGILASFSEMSKKGLLPPGQSTYITGGRITGEGLGGAISSSALGNFNFLRTFLYDNKDSGRRFLTKYVGEGASKAIIYFERKLQERDQYGKPIIAGIDYEIRIQKGTFSIGYSGAQKYAYLDVFARREDIGSLNIKFTFGKLSFYQKDGSQLESIELGTDIIPEKKLIIEAIKPTPSSVYSYRIKNTNNTTSNNINEYFTGIFNRLVPFIRNIKSGDVAMYNAAKPSSSEVGTAEELRLARTIQNLTQTKPLGHCIARALQLLNNVPLKDHPSISYICKAKFLESTTVTATGTKKVTSRSGIPEPGASLDSSPGITALSQLFYDTIILGSPKLQIGTKIGPDGQSSLQQYVLFIKNMARLFGDSKSEDILVKEGIQGIRNKRDRELCRGTVDAFPVSYDNATRIYGFVNRLFKIQVEHAGKCGAIFKLLFNIERDKTSGRYRISLSDSIIKKGFPEIERINSIARTLLIDYYSNCETNYLQGMQVALGANLKQPYKYDGFAK